MTKESMVDLISIFELEKKADKIQELLIGTSYILDVNNCVFGVFSIAFNIIKRECNQSLIDKTKDLNENEFYKILISNELTNKEKAELLLE